MQPYKGIKMNIKLRDWQEKALNKSMKWLVNERSDKHFLINAAPGAGKTIASCAIAQKLLEIGEIDRVIVIAPRSEIVNQWAKDHTFVTDRHMAKVTGADGEISELSLDICATWSAIQSLLPELQAICRSSKTLVICDEHHHAAVEAAWGEGADGAFRDAKFVLVLTGTPIRSDGANSIWLAHDNAGAISHPDEGTFTLTYGEAVDLGYCRPVTFHRHEGRFTVDLDGENIKVTGKQKAALSENLKRIPGLQKALDFYRLARQPQFEKDNLTPLLSGFQATMIESGSEKLDDLRLRMPSAGGLIIAPNIDMAKYMVALLEKIEGERPMLVHSQMPNPNSKIDAFRETNKRWLVSVAMVSEGVDIKRLRVLLYLPNAMTELAFRQAIGRVVRTMGNDDDTRAYVVMPSFETFENYARRVEEEMSPKARNASYQEKFKRCGECGQKCSLGAADCPVCDTAFPSIAERLKPCTQCGAINPKAAKDCHQCGKSFSHDIKITLEEALRDGAIARGIDINEEEVREAEDLAPLVRNRILGSGDHRLIKIIQTLPDESWARLRNIFETG
jgi:superfamily II DNA or RNA helicase